jgi:hypothetical protein
MLLYPFKVIYGVRNNEMLDIAEVISFSLPFALSKMSFGC